MEIATLKRAITTGFGSVYYPKGCVVEVETQTGDNDRCWIKKINAKGPIVIVVRKKDLQFATVKWEKII